ncbi:hypothetical protein ACFY0A_42685 [Streptomyces sp. NPDC001698]|uniref:hypothetical protein n=1 Tax=Streptomyces sp. NPDC001698 TaxID=3364601 RepID=UPI0036C8B220
MSDQEYVESWYGFFDTVRLAVRALVQVVLGGVALSTIVAVALILGPVITVDLYTRLTLPATALLLLPPPALGSYSAAREDGQAGRGAVGSVREALTRSACGPTSGRP